MDPAFAAEMTVRLHTIMRTDATGIHIPWRYHAVDELYPPFLFRGDTRKIEAAGQTFEYVTVREGGVVAALAGAAPWGLTVASALEWSGTYAREGESTRVEPPPDERKTTLAVEGGADLGTRKWVSIPASGERSSTEGSRPTMPWSPRVLTERRWRNCSVESSGTSTGAKSRNTPTGCASWVGSRRRRCGCALCGRPAI